MKPDPRILLTRWAILSLFSIKKYYIILLELNALFGLSRHRSSYQISNYHLLNQSQTDRQTSELIITVCMKNNIFLRSLFFLPFVGVDADLHPLLKYRGVDGGVRQPLIFLKQAHFENLLDYFIAVWRVFFSEDASLSNASFSLEWCRLVVLISSIIPFLFESWRKITIIMVFLFFQSVKIFVVFTFGYWTFFRVKLIVGCRAGTALDEPRRPSPFGQEGRGRRLVGE